MPSLLEREAADYLLTSSNLIARRIVSASVWAFGSLYGEGPLLRILCIAMKRRDLALFKQCLARLLELGIVETNTPSRFSAAQPAATATKKAEQWTARRTSLGKLADDWYFLLIKEKVRVDAALMQWLHKALLKTVQTSASDQLPNIGDEIAGMLSGLLRVAPVEEIKHTADSLSRRIPDNAALLVLRAKCEKWANNLQEARRLLQRAVSQVGCDPMAYFELAETLELLGDDAGTIEVLKKARCFFSDEELFLNNPSGLTMMAGPLMRQGRIAEGWEQYQKRRDRFVLDAPLGRRNLVWRQTRR